MGEVSTSINVENPSNTGKVHYAVCLNGEDLTADEVTAGTHCQCTGSVPQSSDEIELRINCAIPGGSTGLLWVKNHPFVLLLLLFFLNLIWL